MGFAKPIEQYLFGNLLIRIHGFMYLKDIIRGGKGHAEETIMNNKGDRYTIIAGGTSRNICKDICKPLLEADGLTLGGPI